MDTLKISSKTLKASRLAAEKVGVDFNTWAEKALANAAAPSRRASVERMLQDISLKVDQIVKKQISDEKSGALLGNALGDIGSSFKQIGKSTKKALDEARTKTSAAVGEVTAKARSVVGHAAGSEADPVEPPSAKPARKKAVIGKEKRETIPGRPAAGKG